MLAAATLVLAACSGGAAPKGPDFSPQGSFPGDGYTPVPVGPIEPSTQPSQGSSPPSQGGSTPSPSPSTSSDPNVVATKLNSPVGLVVLPDATALVAERATGRIVRVQPKPGQPVQTVRTLGGLSTAGDGGLLDLALSPTYAEDGLIFAYLTTATDNRVVDFTLNGPVTPVFTGIPRGSSGNTGRITFGADGDLYVGTGDAGVPAQAADPASLAGKVLRITAIGTPAPGNPVTRSPIFASGVDDPDALCADPSSTVVYESDTRDGVDSDPVNSIVAGASYGWPTPAASDHASLRLLPHTSRAPGGCTVDKSTLYVTSRDGQALLSSPIRSAKSIGDFTPYLRQRYGRLRTVVAAADGTLWLTTSNRDGHGKPIPDDERVLHIQAPTTGGTSPA
ncbi:MAG: putative oxidoreductase [Jatrophihabitans sp.]|nr:putative oxidoreductase [Jatrophihabitans sp.]